MITGNMPNAEEIKDRLTSGLQYYIDGLGNIWYAIDPIHNYICGDDKYGEPIFLTEDNRLGYYREK